MKIVLKQTIQNNKVLKIVSLILGSITWILIARHQVTTHLIQAPICFYNIPAGTSIKAEQEFFTLKIKGKAFDLPYCSSVALHIDASELKPGQHRLCPSAEQLFLPNSVTLVNHQPLSVAITVSQL